MGLDTPQDRTPYYVEVEANGCGHCGTGQSWRIVYHATDTALGHTFDKAQDAHDLADLLNEAFERGVNLAPSETATSPAKAALDLIHQYAGIDGAHHKQWLLDQLVRTMTGDGYAAWIKEWQAGEDGPETYLWDEGIAP